MVTRLAACFSPPGQPAPTDPAALAFDREKLEAWHTAERVSREAHLLEGELGKQHRRALRRLSDSPTRRRAVALLRAVLADAGYSLQYRQQGVRRATDPVLLSRAPADPRLREALGRKRDTCLLRYHVVPRA